MRGDRALQDDVSDFAPGPQTAVPITHVRIPVRPRRGVRYARWNNRGPSPIGWFRIAERRTFVASAGRSLQVKRQGHNEHGRCCEKRRSAFDSSCAHDKYCKPRPLTADCISARAADATAHHKGKERFYNLRLGNSAGKRRVDQCKIMASAYDAEWASGEGLLAARRLLPSILYEIEQAGRCYACDLTTASVFHSIRC